jgi:hypothetical protein
MDIISYIIVINKNTIDINAAYPMIITAVKKD